MELINLTIPEAAYTTERWSWEYKNNPYGFLAAVAEQNGRIVGHMGLFLMNLKVGDNIIRGSQACDLGVHPDFRGQGIFLAIGKALMKRAGENGILLTYGFPNRPAYFGHLKYGWFDAARIPVLINCFNTYNVVVEKLYSRHKKLMILDPFVKKSSRFIDYHFRSERASERKPRSELNFGIHEISSVDERMDEFWNRVSKDYGMIVVRDQRYLKWRFFDRPDFRYKVLVAEKNDDIEGYMVLSAEKSTYGKVGHIDDALASSEDAARNLIQSAFDFFTKKEVDLVECWMLEESIWYDLLREKGFVPMHLLVPSSKKRFIVHINSVQFLNQYQNTRKGWYVTYGDSDYAGGRPSIT